MSVPERRRRQWEPINNCEYLLSQESTQSTLNNNVIITVINNVIPTMNNNQTIALRLQRGRTNLAFATRRERFYCRKKYWRYKRPIRESSLKTRTR